MESACNGDRLVNGPAAYYTCMSGHVRRSASPHSVKGNPANRRSAIRSNRRRRYFDDRGKAIRRPRAAIRDLPGTQNSSASNQDSRETAANSKKTAVRLSATPGETDGRPVALAAGTKRIRLFRIRQALLARQTLERLAFRCHEISHRLAMSQLRHQRSPRLPTTVRIPGGVWFGLG